MKPHYSPTPSSLLTEAYLVLTGCLLGVLLGAFLSASVIR